MTYKLCGAGLPDADGDEPWHWCVLPRDHKDPHTDGERSWNTGDVVEVTTVEEVSSFGPHVHDFVGDEDTCVRGCPLTWGEFKRQMAEAGQ